MDEDGNSLFGMLVKRFGVFLTCGKTKSGKDSLNSALSLLCGRGNGRASFYYHSVPSAARSVRVKLLQHHLFYLVSYFE